MIPTVGRIVHYYGMTGDRPLAALVTHVEAIAARPNEDEEGWKVSIKIFIGQIDYWKADVPFSREPRAGCWSWPPKV